MITVQQLIAATHCTSIHANQFVTPINAAMEEFDIKTPAQMSAFIAQVAHESGRFQFVREIWNPVQCPWQAKYEGRTDLGNIHPGDGKFFMGRGLIQITGRHNNEECGKALGLDLGTMPWLLETPANAARSAAWFWTTHGCNALADAGNFRAITRVINGGYNGWDDRLALYTSAQIAFNVIGAIPQQGILA